MSSVGLYKACRSTLKDGYCCCPWQGRSLRRPCSILFRRCFTDPIPVWTFRDARTHRQSTHPETTSIGRWARGCVLLGLLVGLKPIFHRPRHIFIIASDPL